MILSWTLDLLAVLGKLGLVTAAVYVTGSAFVGSYAALVVEPYLRWRSSR